VSMTGILGTGLTVANRPAPNTLTHRPYTLSAASGRNLPPFSVNPDFITQGRPCLQPISQGAVSNSVEVGRARYLPVSVTFSDSGATCVIAWWFFNVASQSWHRHVDQPSNTYSANSSWDNILVPGVDAIYPEIVSLSAGTVSVYYDEEVAVRLGNQQ